MIYEFAEPLNICSFHIVSREKASVFSNSELFDILRQNKVSKIKLIGIDGNSCIASRATDAQKTGYSVILPCEYIGAEFITVWKKQL